MDTVLTSTTQLIANVTLMAGPGRSRKLQDLALMLRGALAAQGRVGLMLNVRRADLDAVLHRAAALNRPTVAALSNNIWVPLPLNTVIEETGLEMRPQLKAGTRHASSTRWTPGGGLR